MTRLAETSQSLALELPATLPTAVAEAVIACIRDLGNVRASPDPIEAAARIRTRVLQTLQQQEALVGALFVSALIDLSSQGWGVRSDGETVLLERPESNLNASEEKRRIRDGHLVDRNRQLSEPSMRGFVAQMEETRLHKGQWVSVFSLMRDGRELASALSTRTCADEEIDALRQAIDPYLQFVDGDAECEFTGLRLSDIWRYFRWTWSSAHQSVPGRRMHVLVRDRAAANHPIIGIAALSSPVVQLRVRDDWIGWTPEQVLESLTSKIRQEDANYFDQVMVDAIDDVYKADFLDEKLLSRSELARPSLKTVSRLAQEALRCRRAHEAYPNATNYKASGIDPFNVDWEAQARSFLFRSKRASTLATLLQARHVLQAHGMDGPSKDGLRKAVGASSGRKALRVLLRSAKARHVGIDMLDITTCGAVQPYAAILGGKLVSLLMLSPEIVQAYRARYSTAVSRIASAMKGEVVIREPRLVLLTTTSLYGVASSQYNRLKVPTNELQGKAVGDLSFHVLGRTIGFGSYQFSQETMELGERLVAQSRGGRRVHSIFGEGVNPRLRKLREALATAGLPTDQVLRHGSKRLVYGVPLAVNFRQILLGKSSRPRYYMRPSTPSQGTELIASYWRRRWLASRIRRPEIMANLVQHTLVRPVRHGARVSLQDATEELPLFHID